PALRVACLHRGDLIRRASLAEVLEVAKLAVDLPLDVERLLALPPAPLVACHHHLAALLAQRAVGSAARPALLRCEQRLDLRIDVERRAPPRHAPVGAGLDHLADLLLADL